MRHKIRNFITFLIGSTAQENKPLVPTSKAPRQVAGNDLNALSLPIPIFPATPPSELLEEHKEQIIKIHHVLGLSREEIQTYIDPLLIRYVETVHLLPASEIHHHRSIGGLLRHGLEVAFWAGQCSLAYSFDFQGRLSDKRQHILRWRLAFVIAGLLHDIGKPMVDMVVTDSSGEHVWSPFNEPLWQWFQRMGITGYYVFWRKNRVHKQHESSGFHAANCIIGNDTLAFLSQYDQELLPALFDLLGGQSDRSSLLYKAVSKADSHSTKKDLEKNGVPINTYIQGTPLDLRLVEVMRSLSHKTWTTNQENSVIWHLPSGIYLHWEKAVEDINRTVSSMNFIGVPRDAGILADTLIDSGIAKAYVSYSADTGEEKRYRYHPLKIASKETDTPPIYGLLITDFSYVFNGPCPAPLPDGQVQVVATYTDDTTRSQLSHNETPEDHQAEPVALEQAKESVKPVQEKPLLLTELIEKLVEEQGPPPPLEESPELEHKETAPFSAGQESKQEEAKKTDETPTQSGVMTPADFPKKSIVDNEPIMPSQAKVEANKKGALFLPTRAKTAPSLNVEKKATTQSSSNLVLPNKGSASKKARPQPVEQAVKKPAALVTPHDAALSTTPKKTTKKKQKPPLTIEYVLKRYARFINTSFAPQAAQHMLALTMPTLEQDIFLGVILLRAGPVFYIRYPEGVDALSLDSDVLIELLAKNEALEANDEGKYIHNKDGRRVLRMSAKWSAAVNRAVETIAQLIDPVKSLERAPETARRASPERTKSTLDPARKKSESTETTNQEPEPSKELISVGNSEVYTPALEPVKAPLTTPSMPDAECESVVNGDVLKQDVEKTEKETDHGKEANPVKDEPPFNVARVLTELVEMIRTGEGRWLKGEVVRQGDQLKTSDDCLVAIAKEYPQHTSKEELKRFIFFNDGLRLTVHKQAIFLIID